MRVGIEAVPLDLLLSVDPESGRGTSHDMLKASTERRDSAVLVYAAGEVDAANELSWRRLLHEAAAAADAPGPVVIETDGLDFMGCCAFAALAEVAERCRRRGIGVCVASSKPIVARVIAAVGLAGQLPVYPTVTAALAAIG